MLCLQVSIVVYEAVDVDLLLVDVLLFSHTVALAMRYSADGDDETQVMLASAPSADIAAVPSVSGESGDGRASADDGLHNIMFQFIMSHQLQPTSSSITIF